MILILNLINIKNRYLQRYIELTSVNFVQVSTHTHTPPYFPL